MHVVYLELAPRPTPTRSRLRVDERFASTETAATRKRAWTRAARPAVQYTMNGCCSNGRRAQHPVYPLVRVRQDFDLAAKFNHETPTCAKLATQFDANDFCFSMVSCASFRICTVSVLSLNDSKVIIPLTLMLKPRIYHASANQPRKPTLHGDPILERAYSDP